MAKVFGPLHSDDASGRIKRAIVFLKWKGQNRVRIWARPYNRKSTLQRAARSCFCRAVQGWHSLSEEYVGFWNVYADKISTDLNPVSGFNVFVGAYIQNDCDFPGTADEWKQAKLCQF